MIWILKNISVHLWITTLFAIPLSFYILPGVTRFFPGINSLITAFVTLTGIAVIISFLMDFTIRKIVTGLLKEGQAWERTGILNKAQKNYIKALRIYDTFLLWPFTAKKTAQKISSAIAKFYLNSPDSHYLEDDSNFKLSVLVYLKMNPADKDIAQLWLTRLRKSSIVTPFEQEILSTLAQKYYDDKILSILILDIFLGLERKDFTAKKLYQHVLQEPKYNDRYAAKIEALIGKSEEIIHGKVSFLLPDNKLDKISVRKNAIQIGDQIGKKTKQIVEKSLVGLKHIWIFIGSILSFLILSVVKLYTFIKEHEKLQFYLKAGFLIIVSVLLLFFMVSTMSHIFKSSTTEKEKVKIPIQVSKPFTIQVAAYLKQKHAQRYIDILKKKEIAARIKKIDGGGKTWFVVRISEFTDKKSAAAYGQKLKKQKIIDDFFVNNK
ncbi:SPOR domain-containing protein [Desulfobacterales bacterium HSG17]|nr:SPOR domain-containing protein [Desulfobacterales bacterium HSG17]